MPNEKFQTQDRVHQYPGRKFGEAAVWCVLKPFVEMTKISESLGVVICAHLLSHCL